MKSRSDPITYDPEVDWLVYVLLSESGGRTYVGIGRNPERRLAQHNGHLPGGARSTRAGRPWCLAITFGPYADRSRAQVVEARLKKTRGLDRLDVCAQVLEQDD
jgi:putative endonuclease